MAWTTPKTWTAEVLSSTDLNTYVSDNTQWLYDEVTYSPAEHTYTRAGAVDYSTTSTSLVDIDDPNMVATLTTGGGDVRVTFTSSAYRLTGTALTLSIAVLQDGTAYTAMKQYIDTGSFNVSFSYVFNNVSAGSHTYRMRWRTSTGTVYLNGQHSHFSVREL